MGPLSYFVILLFQHPLCTLPTMLCFLFQAQNALEKIVKKKIQFTEAETIQQAKRLISQFSMCSVSVRSISGDWMPSSRHGYGL